MKNIALIVGHRKSNRGSYGNAGDSEWYFYDKLIDEIMEKLPEYKIKKFYRQDRKGYSRNMRDLHKRLDSWGAQLSIEMHFNGSSNASASGHEVLYASKSGGRYAKKLNALFYKYLPNHLNDRGAKKISSMKQRGGGFLRRGRSVCILPEPFFGSHQSLYMPGTSGRKALIRSFVEFIQGV